MHEDIDSPSVRPPALKKAAQDKPFLYAGNLAPGTSSTLPNSTSTVSIISSDVSFLEQVTKPFSINHSVPL